MQPSGVMTPSKTETCAFLLAMYLKELTKSILQLAEGF
jgi:hypothetical protein